MKEQDITDELISREETSGYSFEEENSIKEAILKLNKFNCSNCKFSTCEQCEINHNEVQALNTILSDYKRVLKENEELKNFTSSIFNENIEKDFIPVQKIKDKIEEYKKMLLSCNRFSDVDRIKAINERILELEELLEGRKQNV